MRFVSPTALRADLAADANLRWAQRRLTLAFLKPDRRARSSCDAQAAVRLLERALVDRSGPARGLTCRSGQAYHRPQCSLYDLWFVYRTF
jgi:hypothetical protein